MKEDDFIKLSQSTFDPKKMGPLLLRGAYTEKLSILDYINKVFETNITLQTPIQVGGESVTLIKVLTIGMQNAFDRDIATAQAESKLGQLKGTFSKPSRPTTQITPPTSSPK